MNGLKFLENNAESWREIQNFIKGLPEDTEWLRWKAMARTVISDLEKLGLATLFWVGGSGEYVVFALVDPHRLAAEPRVTLGFQPEQQTVRVAYSRSDLREKEPLIEAWVSVSSAVMVTLGALRRLWTETRPAVPMPEGLAERKAPPPV